VLPIVQAWKGVDMTQDTAGQGRLAQMTHLDSSSAYPYPAPTRDQTVEGTRLQLCVFCPLVFARVSNGAE
jgi:hypothetical protein